MREKLRKAALATAGLAAIAGPIALADAASKTHHAKKHHAKKHRGNSGSSATSGARHHGPGNPNETVLTGDTKTSAEKAALDAVPGGTVDRSSTEDPAENTGAAYEVHVTKTDGSHAVVLEDSSFNVTSTKADDHGPGGPHGDHHGGPGGPGNPNETVLTGDTKTSAEKAALDAVPGGTVDRSSTEDPAENTGAAYEVHVTKTDGSHAVVLEDSSFNVTSTKADDHGPGGPHGGPYDGGQDDS